MHWLKSIVYGLICGMSEFLPISSSGHQLMFTNVFGSQIQNPISDLLIHISLLAAVIFGNYSTILRMRRDQMVKRRKGRSIVNRHSQYDIRLIKNAAVPMIALLLLQPLTDTLSDNLIILAFAFLLNGVILFLPSRFLKGNKNSQNMSRADALLIGALSGLSVFSGVSRIGASVSGAMIRGADQSASLNWALLLSIPALVVEIIFDIFSFSNGIAMPYAFWHYLLIVIGSFLGGYFSITMIRNIIFKTGFSGFAFYAWGATMLTLILYMIV